MAKTSYRKNYNLEGLTTDYEALIALASLLIGLAILIWGLLAGGI